MIIPKSFCKIDYYIFYFSVPDKLVFKNFAYFFTAIYSSIKAEGKVNAEAQRRKYVLEKRL